MCRPCLWVSFVLVSACATRSAHRGDGPPAEALAQRAMALRTIDPADEDFADLRPIGRAVGDARIVLLGEGTHGDGGTFLAKSRLIKFLHQELGFDVLVFESGFHDCGASGEARFEDCVWPLWWRSDQVKPLIAYREDVAARKPLRLAGMDPDFVTSTARPDFAGSIRAMVPPGPVEGITPVDLRAFLDPGTECPVVPHLRVFRHGRRDLLSDDQGGHPGRTGHRRAPVSLLNGGQG